MALRDALGVKSPRTAFKRAQMLLHFFRWLHGNCSTWESCSRSNCLAYLSSADDREPVASVGVSVLEAIRFARQVSQVPIPDALLQDPQFKGSGGCQFGKDDAGSDGHYGQIHVGCCAFSIFSRSSWSDLQYTNSIWVDWNEFEGQFFGFIETETAYHKTATSLTKKMSFRPPIQGVTDTDRTPAWLATFAMLQVDWDACPFGPICRAQRSDGFLGMRSCTPDGISVFINKVLMVADADKLSFYSFKRTILSWASAYGIDERGPHMKLEHRAWTWMMRRSPQHLWGMPHLQLWRNMNLVKWRVMRAVAYWHPRVQIAQLKMAMRALKRCLLLCVWGI